MEEATHLNHLINNTPSKFGHSIYVFRTNYGGYDNSNGVSGARKTLFEDDVQIDTGAYQQESYNPYNQPSTTSPSYGRIDASEEQKSLYNQTASAQQAQMSAFISKLKLLDDASNQDIFTGEDPKSA